MTHICVSKLAIIGSDNGLSPDRRQVIIWTNPGNLVIGPLGTNFSEILIEIHTFSFKKMHLKMSYGKWRPSCLSLNMMNIYDHGQTQPIYSAPNDVNCSLNVMQSECIPKSWVWFSYYEVWLGLLTGRFYQFPTGFLGRKLSQCQTNNPGTYRKSASIHHQL